jgi:hypothetical protein
MNNIAKLSQQRGEPTNSGKQNFGKSDKRFSIELNVSPEKNITLRSFYF